MSNTARRARPGNPRTAIAYIRVSTEDQKLGPEAQRAAIEAWTAREGVTVVSWHVDAGVSGGSDIAERPGLVAALGALRAERAGVLVVAKRDRLARDAAIAAMIDRAAASSGARVLCADGTANGSTAADQFMRTLLDAASEYERALIRARTKAALAAKRARGERTGELPFGFAADAAGRLIPNAAEQAVIGAIRELRGAGLSLRAVVAELANRGLVSRAQKPLALAQVARIARAG